MFDRVVALQATCLFAIATEHGRIVCPSRIGRMVLNDIRISVSDTSVVRWYVNPTKNRRSVSGVCRNCSPT